MTKFERVRQIWPLLVCAARDGRTYTYKDLAAEIGMPGAWRAMRRYLEPIMCYCEQNELPPLTVLVVNQETRRPGPGLKTVDVKDRKKVKEAQERVFAYDWSAMEPPENDDFEAAV